MKKEWKDWAGDSGVIWLKYWMWFILLIGLIYGQLFIKISTEEQENIRYVNSYIGWSFFTRRGINYWNHLLEVIVGCNFLNEFRNNFGEFISINGEI